MSYQITYNYISIAPPGASGGFAAGINDGGQVVGSSSAGIIFVFGAGVYTTIPSDRLIPNGINDQGQIVGYASVLGHYLGFLYSGGHSTILRYPSGDFQFNGINDLGQIVGNVVGFAVEPHGLLYSGGIFTNIGPADKVSYAESINNGGQIVGYYSDSTLGVARGFLYSGGTYTTLDDPLATSGTYLTGINNTGQIVGYFNDAFGQHGFLYNNGAFTTIDNPLGVGRTALTGINDYGQIVGNYLDGAGTSHGFLGTLAFSAAIAATTVYTKEYGAPPDAAELNVLIEFTTPQYAYGQQIGVINPAVYAYEALGVTLAATGPLFQNSWGPANPMYPNSEAGDAQFAADAYTSVFGHPGGTAQVQHFIDQLNYFEGIYTAAGVFGSASNIDLLARGAIYGQMLGIHAEVDPFGPGGAAGTAEVALVGVSAPSDMSHAVPFS